MSENPKNYNKLYVEELTVSTYGRTKAEMKKKELGLTDYNITQVNN